MEDLNQNESSKEVIEDDITKIDINDSNTQKKVAKNLIFILLSNLASILSGVLIGFMIPKLMSVSDYGFYKTYTLYATYIGLFHLGFSDGVYIFLSGRDFEKLDKKGIRYYTFFLLSLSLFFSLIAVLVGFVAFKDEYRNISIFIGLNIFATHITLYYQGIVQATSRFKEFSIKTFVQSGLNVLFVVGLTIYFYFIKNNTDLPYYVYLYCVTFVNYFMAIWYIIRYRSVTFGKIEKSPQYYSIFKIIRVGLPILFSNLIGTFIMTMDRQFVSILFSNETYAVYAFAYNMLSLVTTAISAISIVLFPTLKQIDENTVKDNYAFLNSALLIIIFTSLSIYFPLCLIIENFLPNYIESLSIFRVIFPGIALTSSITIIMYNIYKKFDKTRIYFLITIGTFVLSFVTNLIAYFWFKTPISISIASIITISIWYIVTEFIIIKKFKINVLMTYIYIIICMVVFYLVTLINNVFIGFGVYFVSILLISFILRRKDFIKMIGLFKKIIKKKE